MEMLQYGVVPHRPEQGLVHGMKNLIHLQMGDPAPATTPWELQSRGFGVIESKWWHL